MANRLQKLLYLLSAETPILLVFALVVVVKESSWVSPYKVSWKLPLVLIICALILNWIFVYSFKFMLEHLQTIPVKGNRITSGDGWLAGYFITYLLPILTFRFGNRIIPLLIIVIVICFIVLTFTDYVTPHPTLYLMK